MLDFVQVVCVWMEKGEKSAGKCDDNNNRGKKKVVNTCMDILFI